MLPALKRPRRIQHVDHGNIGECLNNVREHCGRRVAACDSPRDQFWKPGDAADHKVWLCPDAAMSASRTEWRPFADARNKARVPAFAEEVGSASENPSAGVAENAHHVRFLNANVSTLTTWRANLAQTPFVRKNLKCELLLHSGGMLAGSRLGSFDDQETQLQLSLQVGTARNSRHGRFSYVREASRPGNSARTRTE